MTCRSNNTNCGCSEDPLRSGTPCNNTGECANESCSELMCEACIIHCEQQMSINLNGNSFVIEQGARLNEIIQKLLIELAFPGCSETAPIGLTIVSIGSTSIKLKWKGQSGFTYSVTYTGNTTPVTVNADEVTEYEIINLVRNTQYDIYVTTNETNCQSVILTLKTNA